MTKEQQQVLNQAIEQNGEEAQIDMIIEECAELIHALQRHKRDPSPERKKNVCEEIADVKIMIFQGESMFGQAGLIDTYVESKINRLKVRLHQGKV